MGRGNFLTDHEKGMIDAFEKDGHSKREIAKKINRSRCAVNNYIKRTKHSKRFQVGQKNSVQGINGPISEMLENLENPFLKFNFLVTLMFHVGPISRPMIYFLIFIANFYVKINLKIKICEVICFI